MKLRLFTLLVVVTVAQLGSPLHSQPDARTPRFQPAGNPGPLSVIPGGSAEFQLNVFIPENNHIYVGHVDIRSFNIVTEFSTEEAGWAVEVKEGPDGVVKDLDYILAGRGMNAAAGRYTLQIFETLGRSANNSVQALSIKIRTQMCNSRTNVCYRPAELTQTIPVRLSGARREISHRSLGRIEWANGYDAALAKARQTGQNIFVLITAPSWCGYCQMLERDVMSKDAVATVLNNKFVSLQVLDSSPDLRRFDFDGYPTMLVANASGEVINEINGRSESRFLAAVRPYEQNPGSTTTNNTEETASERFECTGTVTGRFEHRSDGWVQVVAGQAPQPYTENRRDQNFVVLQNSSTRVFYALPLRSGPGYVYENGGWQSRFQARPIE
ncbi:MAG: thioredoxin family protein [Leptospiraceae bacterium]|nr:thioredoxin family protein [Leptospiraceae bacterium]